MKKCFCQLKVQTKLQNDSLQWRLTLNFIKTQALGADDIKMVVMDSYDNSLEFDQCDCSGSSPCKLLNGTRQVIDIGKHIDFWKTSGITLPYVILCFLSVIIMYVVVESFVGNQISMKRFILGPGIERNDLAIDNEG